MKQENKTDLAPENIENEAIMPEIDEDQPVGFKVIVNEFKKDKVAMVSLALIIIFVTFVFITSALMDKTKLLTVDILSRYDPPNSNDIWNIWGKDVGGRSILGLTIMGARNSLLVGFFITLLTSLIGLVVGLTVGFYGGRFDAIVMRVVDFVSVLPTLLLIIVFVSIIPNYNIVTFVFIMTAFYWVGTARLVRSKSLSEARRDYVLASRTMGTSNAKIMFGGILPNISSILIVDATLALAGNIGIETSLSFLGFGLPTATPSLGSLISAAIKPEIIQNKMFVWLPASLVILFMMLCINYVGQALRRAADAKQRMA